MSAIFNKLTAMLKVEEMPQCISNEMADVLYRICFRASLSESDVKKTLNKYVKSRRSSAMHKRLCAFVLGKTTEILGQDYTYMTELKLSDAKTETELNDMDKDLCLLYKRRVMPDEHLEAAEEERRQKEAERKERIELRAAAVEAYHEHVNAVKQIRTLNKKHVYIQTNKEVSKAALGMSPRKFKEMKGLENKVSARNYMNSNQLAHVTTGLLDARNIALQTAEMREYMEKTKFEAQVSFGQCQRTATHGDHHQRSLEADDKQVKEARRKYRARMERNRQNRIAIGMEEPDQAEVAEIADGVRAVDQTHPRYQELVELASQRNGWIHMDSPRINMSMDESQDMYNNAYPCNGDASGLLIKLAEDRFKLAYNQ